MGKIRAGGEGMKRFSGQRETKDMCEQVQIQGREVELISG
jgi:hypothetical protein